MSDNKKNNKELEGKETVEVFKDLDHKALEAEMFMQKYAKQIISAFGVVMLLILAYFAYQQFIVAPKNTEATKSFLAAQNNLLQGKDTLALGGKTTANPGFIGTYDNFSGTKAGKLSAYNAGLIKYQQGKYQEAYDLLDDFSSKNNILMALKFGAMADCSSNLNKNEEALSLLDKAIHASNDPYTIYYFTKKAGVLSVALNKKDDAKGYFSIIDEQYQDYDNGMSDAYIEMVKNY